MDILVASIVLIVFSPILLLSLLIQWIEIGSSPVFIQTRPGKNEVPFNIIKLKTMNEQRDNDGNLLPDNDRITRFGRFFRSASIDELPQLINVLKGDMSFVGPRPDVQGFADELTGIDKSILSLRPGITGPASIKYKNEETLLINSEDPLDYNKKVIWPDKVKINLDYIRNWSFFGDLKYIQQTIFNILV